MSNAVVIVNLQDWDRLAKKLKPETLKPIVEGALNEFAAIGKPLVASKAPRFSGRLSRSVVSIIKYSGAPIPTWMSLGPKAPHRFLVERGTRPHFPPTAADSKGGRRIRRYVRRRWGAGRGMEGEGQERDIARAAFRLARAISRKGAKPHPFIAPAWEQMEGQIEAILGRAGKQLEAEWSKSQ